MLNLNDVYFFVQVVDGNGFSAAGKILNIPKSSLSRRILELEARLGARLIQRTSRRFVVTEAGREFYEHGRAMLAEAEAAEQSVKRRVTEPQGVIRITCSVADAQFVVSDSLLKFVELFPKVDIAQHATNRCVDLIHEGFDLAVRTHSRPLPNSSLIQRPLAATSWGLFAGRPYIERCGLPGSPSDLVDHTGLLLKHADGDCCWKLSQGPRQEEAIPFKPKLCSDDVITLKKAAKNGVGIVALPLYLCRNDVTEGKLTRLLPDWTAGSATITILAPSRCGLLPSVRALSDFLATEFQMALSAGASVD